MKQKILYIAWGCMAALCVGLGTIEATNLSLKIPMICLAVVFFVPGAILLYDALEAGDRAGVLRIRWISVLSLSLTLVTMVAFILTAAVGHKAADVLYDLLILVSCPMICGQNWLIGLFLWSCLFSASFFKKDRK